MNQNNQQKKKNPWYPQDTILESLRGMGSSVGKTVTRDLGAKVANDTFASLLGASTYKNQTRSELHQNEAIPIPQEKSKNLPWNREIILPFAKQQDAIRVRQEIEVVRQELKALAQSIKALHQDIDNAVTTVPVNPGIYHKNFYERLRSILKMLREQVEDSRTWLQLSTSRKKKKHYWGMYKKHGTQFGLSSERTLATQTG